MHRDLKAKNILLNRDDNIKIGDFGVASRDSLLIDSQIEVYSAGSLAVMSPEEYISKMPSKESDIYAFGIILWELLTGKKPSKRTREDKSWLEKPERDEIPAEYCETPQGQIFAELIRACWRKDHQARPSAKKLQQELIAFGSYFHPKAEWVCLAQELAEQFHHGQQELSLNYQPSNLVSADLEQRVWVDDFLTQKANLFLTGKSGSGKSFTLNRWGQSQLKKCWSWIDNTGIELLNPYGRCRFLTIH